MGWRDNMKKFYFFFIVAIFVMSCGVASASVTYVSCLTDTGNHLDSINNKIVITNEHGRNLTWLEGQLNNQTLLRNSGKTFYLNSSMTLDNSDFYINDSDCNVIYMSNQVNGIRYGQGGFLGGGSLYVNNITAYSWDYNTSTVPDCFSPSYSPYNQAGFVCDGGNVWNCTFEGIYGITMNSLHNTDFNNIKMNNSYSGYHLNSCSNMNISNVSISNVSGSTAFIASQSHDIHLENVSAYNTKEGIIFITSTYNSSMDNVSSVLSGWGGVEGSRSNNLTYTNIRVDQAGHDGLDLHLCTNVYVHNVTVTNGQNGEANGIILSNGGEDGTLHDITLDGVYTANKTAISDGITIANGGTLTPITNITISNFTDDGHAQGLETAGVDNLTVINMTSKNTTNGYFGNQRTNNTTFIDSNLSGSAHGIALFNLININLINTYFNNQSISFPSTCSYNTYYYSNVRTLDGDSNPINNVVISSNTTTKNGNGLTQTTFFTDSEGKLYNYGNRSNWLAIPEKTVNSSGTTTYTSNITASYQGSAVSKIATPTTTWYSPLPSILQSAYLDFKFASFAASVDGQTYATIQAAINAASQGQTVYVYPGSYIENIIVNKSITVEGISGNSEDVILKSPSASSTIEMTATGATIKHISANDNSFTSGTGVKITSDNCIIEDCAFKMNSVYSIWDRDAHNTQVKGCYVYSGSNAKGIFIDDSDFSHDTFNITVTNCTIWGGTENIRDSFGNSNTFTDNYIELGINLFGGSSNTFKNNIFALSKVHSDQILHLEASTDNNIINNVFMFGASKIDYGGSCTGNMFSQTPATGAGIGGSAKIGGNIWTTQSFTDSNNDGFADSAYTVSAGMSATDNYPVVYNISTVSSGSVLSPTFIAPTYTALSWTQNNDPNFVKYILYRGWAATGRSNYKVFESSDRSVLTYTDSSPGFSAGRRPYYTLETQYSNGTSYYSSVESWSIHHTQKKIWVEGDSISTHPYFDNPTSLGWVDQFESNYVIPAGWSLDCTAVSGKTVNTSNSQLQEYSQTYDNEVFITEIGVNDHLVDNRDANASYSDVYNQTNYMAVRGSVTYWMLIMPDNENNIFQKTFNWNVIRHHPVNTTIVNTYDSLDSVIENGNFDDYNLTNELGGSVHPNTIGGGLIADKVFRLLCMGGTIQNETYCPRSGPFTTPTIVSKNPKYSQIKYDGSTTTFNANTSTSTDSAWYINDMFTRLDKSTSTPQLPLAVKSSDYTISMRAMNPSNYDAYSEVDWVPVPPISDFIASPTSGEHPVTVAFTDQSIGPTSWLWNFGDGTTGTTRNVTHTYSVAGNYNVSLTTTNEDGSDSEVKTNYVIVTAVPDANFSANRTTITQGQPIQFNDTSLDNPTSWAWTFGDGNTSTDKNATHTYSVAGNYNVTLTVTNSYGSNSTVKTNYINVKNSPPVAAFSADPLIGNATTVIRFIDSSTGKIDSWAWDFENDGVIDSTVQNPVKAYTAEGVYTVNLTVTNDGGSDSETKIGYILVSKSNGANQVNYFYWQFWSFFRRW